MKKIFISLLLLILFKISACECSGIVDKYNPQKDYFDYSVVLNEYPKEFYYTTVKIAKSKERILIITDNVNHKMNSYDGLFYYFGTNGFVFPLGYIKSDTPLSVSKNYIHACKHGKNIKFYLSDKKLSIIALKAKGQHEKIDAIEFVAIKSADKFARDYGEPAGDDIKRAKIDGFYFDYHKPQYKGKFIKKLMRECINDGVKTQVQMYCCVVNKLHP